MPLGGQSATRATDPAGIPTDVLLDSLLEATPVALAVFDRQGRLVRSNGRYARTLEQLSARPSQPQPGSLPQQLVDAVLKSGEPVYVDQMAAGPTHDWHLRWRSHPMRLPDGTPIGALIVIEDVTEATRLGLQAQTDPLTGLLNHGTFHERLREEVERARRHGRHLALALIDIDEFKAINDTFGHPTGDRVLADVAAILLENVRANDLSARIGGDEFALLMPETDVSGAAVLAERVHSAVSGTIVGSGQHVTLSIGVCDLDEDQGPDDLMRFADRALYWSKTHGRDMVSSYSPRAHAAHGALAAIAPSDRLAHGQATAAVRALARAIDLKHAATRQHSDRVGELAARVAQELGWPADRVELLREAALIHDLGKVGIPDAILLKPERLTPEEYAVVKAHPEMGAQIAHEILCAEQTSWLRSHHERWDGSGYPDGLAGEEIPDGARILAVVDAYDVMISDRPYRNARDPLDALQELRRCAGSQFAPEVVEAFTRPRIAELALIHSNQLRCRGRNAFAHPDAHGHVTLACECWDLDCRRDVDLDADELHAAREHQRRFVVYDGHDRPESDRVVARTPRFNIIEKVV